MVLGKKMRGVVGYRLGAVGAEAASGGRRVPWPAQKQTLVGLALGRPQGFEVSRVAS